MRIRVTDVLDLLSNGLTSQQVLEELPDLEPEDIHACLQYATLPRAVELIARGDALVEISGKT